MWDYEKLNAKTPLSFVFFFAATQRSFFFIQGILCFFWSLKEALFPYFIKVILDRTHANDDLYSSLILPLYGLGATWVLMEIAMRLQGLMGARAFPRFRASIRRYCFEFLLSRSPEELSSMFPGEQLDHFITLPLACQAVLETVLLHILSILGAVLIAMILLIQVEPFFAFLLLIWLLVHWFLAFNANAKISSLSSLHAREVTRLSGNISDVFANFMAVKWFHREFHELEKFESAQRQEEQHAYAAQSTIEKMRLIQSIFIVFYLLTMLLALTYFWRHKIISIGDLAMVPMLSFSTLGMIWWLTQELNTLYRELNRIRSTLSSFKQQPPEKSTISVINQSTSNKKPAIRCAALKFSIGDQVIIDIPELDIPFGTHVGITGLSGSGKTTFLKLLSGILLPSSGDIFIGDHNIQQLSPGDISSLIAVVPQEINTFNRSILENIRYGNLTVTKEQIEEVAKQTLIHDFIKTLPNGYQTVLGDERINLSLGQKQRILIARAILTKSPIIIMDEPTASLDVGTEKFLIQNLKASMFNRTLLLISHRVNTLCVAERIIVFNEGKIVEEGEKNNLLYQDGYFNKLCQEQLTQFKKE